MISQEEFWKKFCEQRFHMTVHCKTEQQAQQFCQMMKEHGLTWRSGNEHLKNNTYWEDYKEDTCYSNDGGYGFMEFYTNCDYVIYEFSKIFITKNTMFMTFKQKSYKCG